MKKIIVYGMMLLLLFALILACQRAVYKPVRLFNEQQLSYHWDAGERPFLKVHMKDGGVAILGEGWIYQQEARLVCGEGLHYNFRRNLDNYGYMEFPLDQVALFETNDLQSLEAGSLTGMSLLVGADLILGIYCLINPKACFGSCPTFYLNENHSFHYADAEGFTNAVLPSLEYTDVDALNNGFTPGGAFPVTMKNEALETHCLKEVKLLAYPRQKDERIFHTPSDEFFLCRDLYPIDEAQGEEGLITYLLRHQDQQERYSLADPGNLYKREELFLSFRNVNAADRLGLVLHFRQSLMSTYIFYTGLAYAGDRAGEFAAKIETDPRFKTLFTSLELALGGIEVYLWDPQSLQWTLKGSFNETGPIAINRQMIPLDQIEENQSVHLKLILNKGLWRIDYAALTNVISQVQPMVLDPAHILSPEGEDPEALQKILDPESYLYTMPGDTYKFVFSLPMQHPDYELFLHTRGYYLEWLRNEWVKEKNLLKLFQLIYRPKSFLKAEAKNYKLYESQMEEQFWNSRILTKPITRHENEMLDNHFDVHDAGKLFNAR